MRLATNFSFFVLALFLAVLLSVRQAEMRQWDTAVSEVRGDDLVTFRLKADDERYLIDWTQADLGSLINGAVPGTTEILWRGGSQRTQVAGESYAIPFSVVSTGYSDRFMGLVAQTPAKVPDGLNEAILSETMARELYGDTPLVEILGRKLTIGRSEVMVANVYEGDGPALLPQDTPPIKSGTDTLVVDQVLVAAATPNDVDALVEDLNAFLAVRPHLASLEAVSYRAFVDPGVPLDRQPYARELKSLFEALVVATIIMAVLNLVQVGRLWAGRQLKRWSLLRTVGADKSSLLTRELPMLLLPSFVSGWSGSLVGFVTASWPLGYEVGWIAFAITMGIITACILLAAVPLAIRLWRSSPWRVLHNVGVRHGRQTLPLGSLVALVGTMALVVVAGGLAVSGRSGVDADIEQIGRTLVRFRYDFNSIYASLPFDTNDLEAVREVAPGAAFVLLGSASGQLDGRAIMLRIAIGNYLKVAGFSDLVDEDLGPGVVIGQEFAREHPVGSALTLQRALRASPEQWTVLAHAPPEPEYLESIRPRDDQVVILLPDDTGLVRANPSTQLYATFGEVAESVDTGAVLAALNSRRSGHAQIVIQTAASSLLGRLSVLQRQSQLLLMTLPFILATAAIGATAIIVDWAATRLYATALHRAFGASLKVLFDGTLRSLVATVAVLSSIGTVVGSVVLYIWAPTIGDDTRFPYMWWVTAIVVAFVLGGLAAIATARWIHQHSPMSVLRTVRE